jgi:hypothetical protein
MGEAARRQYEALYTPERNLTTLLGIYRQVIGQAPTRHPLAAGDPS